MASGRVFSYVCGFCEKPSEIRESHIAAILACPHCGQVLYEIDDEYKRIRVTKNFRIVYRKLLQSLKDLRTVTRDFENFASGKGDCNPDQLAADLSRFAASLRSRTSELLNENEFSDSDTRDSVSGAAALILSQSDRLQKASEVRNGKADEKILSHAKEIRSAEKEIFAFIRMLDKYLHERSDLLL